MKKDKFRHIFLFILFPSLQFQVIGVVTIADILFYLIYYDTGESRHIHTVSYFYFRSQAFL